MLHFHSLPIMYNYLIVTFVFTFLFHFFIPSYTESPVWTRAMGMLFTLTFPSLKVMTTTECFINKYLLNDWMPHIFSHRGNQYIHYIKYLLNISSTDHHHELNKGFARVWFETNGQGNQLSTSLKIEIKKWCEYQKSLGKEDCQAHTIFE